MYIDVDNIGVVKAWTIIAESSMVMSTASWA